MRGLSPNPFSFLLSPLSFREYGDYYCGCFQRILICDGVRPELNFGNISILESAFKVEKTHKVVLLWKQ